MPGKSSWDTAALIAADKRHIWHPFTPMAAWCVPEHQPLVLVEGEGALLWDSNGNQYIDGNSSIWTNIHGHNHPHINGAIKRQLERVAHTSFLGFTNPAAIRLAEMLVDLFPPGTLSRVFFSDDGSTAMEVALRIVEQYWRLKGAIRPRFLAFRNAYHGDTAGAASLGAAQMFRSKPAGWDFPALTVGSVAELEAFSSTQAAEVAAVVIEPLVQGAAGMKLWPAGTLADLREWCDHSGALLITDEVLTGFGRTGTMFACEREGAYPDLMMLGKALTGGYVPLAVTLLTEKIMQPFLEAMGQFTTLFYGHSYSGNPVGCAAAIASLEIFTSDRVLERLAASIALLADELAPLELLPHVREVRQCGFIAGIELRSGEESAENTPPLGAAVCAEARKYGLLTRPIGNVVVLMPPYCITDEQLRTSVRAIREAIRDVFGGQPAAGSTR